MSTTTTKLTSNTLMNNRKKSLNQVPMNITDLSARLEPNTMIDCHLSDELLLQTTFKWMFWSPHHLVKDDVFFAPSITTIQPNNHTNWVPTPCLSPVTSPSDFLYDREPLFDGIEDAYNKEETGPCPEEQKQESSTIIMHVLDDDWSTLFSGDEYDFLPLTPSTGLNSEYEHEEQDVVNETVVDDDVSTTTTNNLKRILQDQENQVFKSKKKAKTTSNTTTPTLTLFQNLTRLNIDWCRYCGTTEGVNWRPGPWGKRTLCNKHGCDYKGYGLASRLPRLDLSSYLKEKLQDRKRPIVQEYCIVCQLPEKTTKDKLISCQGGCSRAYHRHCRTIKEDYCHSTCLENKQKNKVVVDLPRKYLPLMRQQPKKQL